tara:strand:+ start:974 stop:1723 length:750 start_codon:yes stop_codon:yes gene_type:complete
MIDSGAFSVKTVGAEITVANYVEFIKSLPVRPYGYMTLDVLGNSKKTLDNYIKLKEYGLDPIPIFTRGAHLSDLDHYRDSKIIALGNIGASKVNYFAWIDRVKLELQTREIDSTLHLLGKTEASLIHRWSPSSVDASSWNTSRWGLMTLYSGGGKFISVNKKDLPSKIKKYPWMVSLIRSHGLSVADCFKETKWRGGSPISEIASAVAWLRYAEDIEKRYGTKVFLATMGSKLPYLLDHYQEYVRCHTQ